MTSSLSCIMVGHTRTTGGESDVMDSRSKIAVPHLLSI